MRSNPTVLCSKVGSQVANIGRSCALMWIALLLLAALPAIACADDELPDRVGRIASVAGQLYLSPEDRATEWAAIGINYPVTSGDNLWVSGDGQAEVDYGGGQFRLAGDTSVHLSRLDDRQLALFVAQGHLIVRLRELDPGDSARIDTPGTQVQLTRSGLYRVDVAPDGQTTSLIVREGEANVLVAGTAQQALPGQTVTVGGAEPAAADIRNGVSVDSFDTWSADRDRRYEGSRSAPYVSRQMVGGSDLDDFGRWESYPEYGAVWFPNAVATDWVPYRDGYWTSVGAWGLTWVDYAPWGFAPFHYGRWTRIGNRWGWCPGSYVARPVWAPALVAWHGGSAWGRSRSAGSPVYGWVPLAWGEPYHPSWSNCGDRCWARHNRPYAVDTRVRPHSPPVRYANMAVPGALTAVAGTTLIRSKPVAINAIKLPLEAVAGVPALAAAPNVRASPAYASPARPGSRMPVPASTLDRTLKPAPVIAQPQPRLAAPSIAAPSSGGRVVSAPPPRADIAPSARPRDPAPPAATTGPQGGYSTGRNVALPAPHATPALPMDRAVVPGAAMPPARNVAPPPVQYAVPPAAMPVPRAMPQAAPAVLPGGAPHPAGGAGHGNGQGGQAGAQGGSQVVVPPPAGPGGGPIIK